MQAKFTHLLAGVLADALDAEKYDEIAQSLREHEFGKLTKALQKKGKLDVRYWICAFSVNQHAGICATPPPTDSTGHAITPCSCTTAKHFEGDLSEARLQLLLLNSMLFGYWSPELSLGIIKGLGLRG